MRCYVSNGSSSNSGDIGLMWSRLLARRQQNKSLKLCSHCLCSFFTDSIRYCSKGWAFSIPLDTSAHQGISYLDVRCRFYYNGAMQNFQLLDILFQASSSMARLKFCKLSSQ